MKLKVLFPLNCESSKYIAKLFYLSIVCLATKTKKNTDILHLEFFSDSE